MCTTLAVQSCSNPKLCSQRNMLPQSMRLTSGAFTWKSVSSLRAHAVYARIGCTVFQELTAGTTVFWSTVAVVSEKSKRFVCSARCELFVANLCFLPHCQPTFAGDFCILTSEHWLQHVSQHMWTEINLKLQEIQFLVFHIVLLQK